MCEGYAVTALSAIEISSNRRVMQSDIMSDNLALSDLRCVCMGMHESGSENFYRIRHR